MPVEAPPDTLPDRFFAATEGFVVLVVLRTTPPQLIAWGIRRRCLWRKQRIRRRRARAVAR